MASGSLWLIWTVVLIALAFDYINGFHDTANSIATTVLTGALSIPWAILLAASLNFLGAFMSKAVATTIGKGIVDPGFLTLTTVLAALIGAIIWNLITWWKGLPSSSSHALIGGLVGAVGGPGRDSPFPDRRPEEGRASPSSSLRSSGSSSETSS